jgi:hypothetical protein
MTDDERIDEIRARCPADMTAGEFAPHLPEELRQPYWRRKLDEFFYGEFGYHEGPTLSPIEAPWPTMWEQDPHIDDGHPHEWEKVHLIGDGQHRRFTEDVVRCRMCSAPRCGNSTDRDPCMERRHHVDLHIHLKGGWRTLGDLLPSDAP